MNIIISNTGGQPIYEQIASQIKALIISGRFEGRRYAAFHAFAGQGIANQRDHHQARL